jgi:hypothetical protein
MVSVDWNAEVIIRNSLGGPHYRYYITLLLRAQQNFYFVALIPFMRDPYTRQTLSKLVRYSPLKRIPYNNKFFLNPLQAPVIVLK